MQSSLYTTVSTRPFGVQRPSRGLGRSRLHVQAGWFDFFGGGKGGAGKGKAAELVEELLTVSRRAGGSPRAAVKEEIEELVRWPVDRPLASMK